MKRTVSLLLCLACLLAFPVSAAAGEAPAVTVQTSSLGPTASMAAYREVFARAEDGSAMLTKSAAAVLLAHFAGEELDVGDAVRWCEENHIFRDSAGDVLTREELCLAIHQALLLSEQSLVQINKLFYFYDYDNLSYDLRRAAAVIQRAGVMIEAKDGKFYPNEAVTRGEGEKIFLRLFAAVRENEFPGMPMETVPESEPVDNAWFDDACFIGHSQVVGMARYFTMKQASYLCAVGFTAKDMLTFEYFQDNRGWYGALATLLRSTPGAYKKVYIMLGVNDIEVDPKRETLFKEPMRKILDIVKETQPDARIYMLSLAPVGRETPYNLIYNPENVLFYSQMIKSLSREYGAEYLDLFRLMADSEWYIKEEFNDGDGIHIRAAQYKVIEEYLKCHTLP